MIEVFKTNVQEKHQAKKIIGLLQQHFPGSKINFDLEDCDKVLRIDSQCITAADVINTVKATGFMCEELE
ncbi:MAG TPA: hypothetical protein VMT76_12625 [Puia sp.]|nr:hypothetical protein [Puia sp.]